VLTRRAEIGSVLRIPLNSYEGNYVLSPAELGALESIRRVVLRYVDERGDATVNPNGSVNAIAAIANAAGNVAGLMPHPERANEEVLGSADGRVLLESFVDSLQPVPV
jgi:phosphoribosylformylglycinamidine synthase